MSRFRKYTGLIGSNYLKKMVPQAKNLTLLDTKNVISWEQNFFCLIMIVHVLIYIYQKTGGL